MLTRVFRALAALACACSIAAIAHASTAQFWTVSTRAELLKGEMHDLSIDNYGRLILGPVTRTVYETSAPFIWSAVAAPDGTLYIGTGNEGKVFRISPDGKASLLFDANEIEVHAMALMPDGSLLVGTSPDGRVYRVTADGTAKPFFDPDDKYIWSIAVDSKGIVYVATGEKGAIYKVTPDGKGSLFYKTEAAHATALAIDPSGNLIVGTSSPARLLRVSPAGKPFVMLDSSYQEIHQIRIDSQGIIYAAAMSGSPVPAGSATPAVPTRSGGQLTSAPVPTVSAEITSMSVVDTSGGTTTASSDDTSSAQGPKGALYRVTPDGLWDQIWQSTQDAPYDLTFESDGSMLVATGNRGRLYRLSGDPLEATLVDSAASGQITTFARTKDHLYYATANPGKVFELASRPAAQGTYTSDVRDAQMVSRWGTIVWRASVPAGSKLDISTRTGNTARPDATWSDWSAAYQNADGSLITSPPARYLQWRATLSGSSSPVLTAVTAAYLPRNVRPSVQSITVYPPGIVFQKPYSAGEPDLAGFEGETTPERTLQVQAAAASQGSSSGPTLGRRAYEKGLQTFTWKASDANDDDLSYDVLYRREDETQWKVLKQNLTDQIFVWDASLVPDGNYLVKVVASDAPSNPPGMALKGELESSTFTIDNQPPSVKITGVKRQGSTLEVTFTATDRVSIIQGADYSTDGQAWHAVYPVDGIADSSREDFRLTLPDTLLNHTIVIRALDSMNNVAAVPLTLTLVAGTGKN
jgi:hypothetical protein